MYNHHLCALLAGEARVGRYVQTDLDAWYVVCPGPCRIHRRVVLAQPGFLGLGKGRAPTTDPAKNDLLGQDGEVLGMILAPTY